MKLRPQKVPVPPPRVKRSLGPDSHVQVAFWCLGRDPLQGTKESTPGMTGGFGPAPDRQRQNINEET